MQKRVVRDWRKKDFPPLLMMRVARAGVGVDCGSDAADGEPRTWQRHTLTPDTEEAVFSPSLHADRRTLLQTTRLPPELLPAPSQTTEAKMRTCREVRQRGETEAALNDGGG